MDGLRRFQYLSDLHLEARRVWPYIPCEAPCLLLAGDIGNPKKETLGEFFRDVSRRFPRCIYVPGNHEYFGDEMGRMETRLKEIVSLYPNITYLHNQTCLLTEYARPVQVVGSTLWAPCPPTVRGLRDFRKIFVGEPAQRFRPEDMERLYRENVRFLTKTLETNQDLDTVVVTHHGPMRETEGAFADHPASLAYASDLTHLMHGHVKAWIYGHTHQNMSLRHGHCLVATNALGYPGEKVRGFRPASVFEI